MNRATLCESVIIGNGHNTSEVSGGSTRRKPRTQYFGDFSGNVEDYTTEELKIFFELAKSQVNTQVKRMKRLNQRVRRQARKIDTLTKLVQKLEQQNLATPEVAVKIMV